MFLDGIAFKVLKTKDYAKLALWLPKFLLKATFIWPESLNKFACILFMASCGFMDIGIIWHFIYNIDDTAESIPTIMSFAPPFRGFCLYSLIWYHSKDLKLILHGVLYEFWPHDLIDDEELKKSLKKLYSIVLIPMILIVVFSVVYFFALLTAPLILSEERRLPYTIQYPFDWLVSPAYELIYCHQCLTLAYIVCFGVVGFDFFILAICQCVIAQYEILQCSFLKFNTNDMLVINRKCEEMGEKINHSYDESKRYLVNAPGFEYIIKGILVLAISMLEDIEETYSNPFTNNKGHFSIFRITETINKAFSSFELVVLAVGSIAICVGLFCITSEYTTFSQYVAVNVFFITYMSEMLIYCAIGNELNHQAGLLPQYIFSANWRDSPLAMKKDIMFILKKSQHVPELMSYDVFKIDLKLFLAGLCLYPLIWYHSKDLKLILEGVLYEFWPYDLIDDNELKKSLKKLYSIVLIAMISIVVFSAVYFFALLSAPLILSKERTLPTTIQYPFDWLVSPAYELIYCHQCLTLAYIVCFGVVGFDFFILAVCLCVIAQYEILQCSFLKFNTNYMFDINRKCEEMGEKINHSYDESKRYLVRCIKHHQLLLRITGNINKAFSSFQLVVLAIGSNAICIGLFSITREHSTFSQNVIVNFVIGFMSELLIYCAIGNEMNHQAGLLPQYIFSANWRDSPLTMRKDIMFILRKSQHVPELMSYDVFKMDLMLFVTVNIVFQTVFETNKRFCSF
ncbi:hypothetical protein JTB14_022739 [Gonioctena quinquepunctata]|nr:hypothetical protein JTB14_022739 [Gonioctena quinquepunctata]